MNLIVFLNGPTILDQVKSPLSTKKHFLMKHWKIIVKWNNNKAKVWHSLKICSLSSSSQSCSWKTLCQCDSWAHCNCSRSYSRRCCITSWGKYSKTNILSFANLTSIFLGLLLYWHNKRSFASKEPYSHSFEDKRPWTIDCWTFTFGTVHRLWFHYRLLYTVSPTSNTTKAYY